MRPIPVLGQVAGSSLPPGSTFTSLPWHCQQPLTAAALLPCRKRRGDHAAISLHDFRQDVVERAEDAGPFGVMRVGELFAFAHVTPAAVLGRDDRRNPLPFVQEGIRLPFLRHVALEAAHVRAVVLAVAPLLVESRVLQLVAFDTGLGLR